MRKLLILASRVHFLRSKLAKLCKTNRVCQNILSMFILPKVYNIEVHVVCAQVLQLSFASSLINVILHEMVPKEIGSWPIQCT